MVEKDSAVWDEYKLINFIPKPIQNLFVEDARFLYGDLSANKLHIVLIPAPEPMHVGHRIRKVEIANPDWYSKLYHQYVHFRRDRSLKALERIIKKVRQRKLKKHHFPLYPSL